MPFCIFDRATLTFVGGVRWDRPPFDPASQVLIELSAYPSETERWDGATGVRPATPQELDSARAAARDLEATRMEAWLRAALRVIAPRLSPAMLPQDLIQAVQAEYRAQLDQAP